MKSIYTPFAVFLIVFYAAVLFAVLNPRVSREYREYYIEKNSHLSPFQLGKLKPLQAGVLYRSDDEQHLGFKSGWSSHDAGWRQIIERTAKLGVNFDQLTIQSISLFALQGERLNGVLDVRLNGLPLKLQPHGSNELEARYSIPRNLLLNGLNEVTIHLHLADEIEGNHDAGRPNFRLAALGFI